MSITPQLPPMSARLAILAAAGKRLVAIVCHQAEAGPPSACQGAEDAVHRAALVCPTGAVDLLPDLSAVERVFLRSVADFPPAWPHRRELVEHLIPARQPVPSEARWRGPLDATLFPSASC